jgi:hypothetical protein
MFALLAPLALLLVVALNVVAAPPAVTQVAQSSSTPSPTPSPSPTPTPEPLNVTSRADNNDASPIYIYKSGLGNTSGNRYVQCLSFRNVSNKVATDVNLSFVVTNYNGVTEAEMDRLDKGKFTPPIGIDNHCWYGNLFPARVVRRMTTQTVRVKSVMFEDGTTWQPGTIFTRAYTGDGQPLASPTTVPGSAGLPPATSTAPIAGGGSAFGAIFYSPGTFATGLAVDRPSPDQARADARSACNASAGGAGDCRLGVEFSRQRCGAVGVLGGQVEYGVGDNDRDARAMVLGKIPGARILNAGCNAQ